MDTANATQTVHFLDTEIRETVDPVLINLIGVGGTGSRVLSHLADMNEALLAIGHPGLHVNVFDSDTVSINNIGRQRFSKSEIGQSKAVSLVNRVNRFYGVNWRCKTFPFSPLYKKELTGFLSASISISCVDTVKSRFEIEGLLLQHVEATPQYRNRSSASYWMDFGNSRFCGQVFLSTLRSIAQPESKKYFPVSTLPLFTQEYREELIAVKDNTEPSCSMQEALSRQDLFVNPKIALEGCRLLWGLLTEGITRYRGIFVNVRDFKSTPIPIPILDPKTDNLSKVA